MKFKKIFEKVISKKYIHKGGSSFTIKKIEDTYGTDKLKAEADFKVYAALFESSIEDEGSKTSNMSTTLMDKEAFNTDLKEGKHITVKGDPADSDYKREEMKKDLSNVLSDIKKLRSDYLNEKDKELKGSYAKGLNKKEKDIAKREIKTTTKKSDDDPSAYKQWDSDKEYKKRGGKTKKSKHTNAYKDMYESDDILENSTKALKNKAEESGVDYSILKQVFSRGMAAWKTGHRPGVSPHQWAMARVNSFLTGGKTQKTTDKDLWDKVKK